MCLSDTQEDQGWGGGGGGARKPFLKGGGGGGGRFKGSFCTYLFPNQLYRRFIKFAPPTHPPSHTKKYSYDPEEFDIIVLKSLSERSKDLHSCRGGRKGAKSIKIS